MVARSINCANMPKPSSSTVGVKVLDGVGVMVLVMVRLGVKVCDGGSVDVGTGVSLGSGVAVADGTAVSVVVGDSEGDGVIVHVGMAVWLAVAVGGSVGSTATVGMTTGAGGVLHAAKSSRMISINFFMGMIIAKNSAEYRVLSAEY
jgi:hypothetical protein